MRHFFIMFILFYNFEFENNFHLKINIYDLSGNEIQLLKNKTLKGTIIGPFGLLKNTQVVHTS